MESVEVHSITECKRLVVFLHGVGSDANDLIGLVPLMQKAMSDVHFYSPDGLEPYDSAPWGRQWFSLRSREYNDMVEEIERVSDSIMHIIEEKRKKLNLERKNVILFGFSQGAMVSLYLNLKYGGFDSIVACSGAFMKPVKIEDTSNAAKICLLHGEDDAVLDISCLTRSERALKEMGLEVTAHSFANLGHGIDQRVITKAIQFINSYGNDNNEKR